MHERYRRQTTDDSRQIDGLATTYSEREREFAKNRPAIREVAGEITMTCL